MNVQCAGQFAGLYSQVKECKNYCVTLGDELTVNWGAGLYSAAQVIMFSLKGKCGTLQGDCVISWLEMRLSDARWGDSLTPVG